MLAHAILVEAWRVLRDTGRFCSCVQVAARLRFYDGTSINGQTTMKLCNRDDLALQDLNELTKFANVCELPARVRCSLTVLFAVAPASTPQLANSLTSCICERVSCDRGSDMTEVQRHSKGPCGYTLQLSQFVARFSRIGKGLCPHN